jgi:hypothetical protein
VSQWRRRFKVGALDADVGSRAQQLQAMLARVQSTTAVHIKDLCSANSNTQRRPAPRSASMVPCARVRFASQQRCVESDACRAELASHCYQQLLAYAQAGQRRRRTRRREQRLAPRCVPDAAGDAAARGLSIAKKQSKTERMGKFTGND